MIPVLVSVWMAWQAPLLTLPPLNPLGSASVELGRKLFSDKRLSKDGSVACVSCHVPHHAFTDGRERAEGIGGATGERNTPTLVNRGSGRVFFLDGRSPTLEDQVLQPIANPKEMASTAELAATRVGLSVKDLANSLASYVRTIRSSDSLYDKYVSGKAMYTDVQRLGLELFEGKANCRVCHGGPNFTDEAFHNTGVAWRDGQWSDEGRSAVTGLPGHRGAFKTPTLREIENTAPYMHDGSQKTLEEVVEYYDRGGRPNPHLDWQMKPLHLSADEKRALVEFMRTLSGTVREGL